MLRIFLGAVIGLALSGAAFAQSNSRQVADCANDGLHFSPATRVAACTAIIEAGGDPAFSVLDARFNRARGYWDQENHAAAAADYDYLVAALPNSADMLIDRAGLYFTAHDYGRAIADYDRAIALDPRSAFAFSMRGETYHELRDYAHAIADYDAALALALDRNEERVVNIRERAINELRHHEEQIAEFSRALQRNPRDTEALNARCWERAIHGVALEQALADCNAALSITDDPNIYDSRALVQLRLGNFQAAQDDYDTAVRADPSLYKSLYGRGLARIRLGRIEEGRADLAASRARSEYVVTIFARYGFYPDLRGDSAEAQPH